MIERYQWFAADGPRRDPGCVARWQLISTLASYGDRRATEVFFDAIETVQMEPSGAGFEDRAVALRAQAAAALGQLGPPGALLAISLLLFDDEPKVPTAPQEEPFATLVTRQMAARALAALGDPGGVAVLGLKLAYPGREVPEVLVECMDAVAALDAEAALKLIPPYLSHRNPYLVAGAATALATLTGRHQEPILEMLVDACFIQSQEARDAVALAVASMRGDGAISALERLSSVEDPGVRMAVVPALAQKGGPRSKEILFRLANDVDIVVSRTLLVRAWTNWRCNGMHQTQHRRERGPGSPENGPARLSSRPRLRRVAHHGRRARMDGDSCSSRLFSPPDSDTFKRDTAHVSRLPPRGV